MNVTVVGSYNADQEGLLYNAAAFQEACEAIGQSLAIWEHRLIVPHWDYNDTAEGHALRGFEEKSTHYFKCPFHKGDPVLKAHFQAVEMSDAVILIGGLNGTYASGLSALRRKKLIIPIPAFGGSAKDLCEIPEIDQVLVDPIRNLNPEQTGWLDMLTRNLKSVMDAYPRILVIHGRGDSGEGLFRRVTEESKNGDSRLFGLADPVIMNLRGKGALSIPGVFEDLASQVSAAIAIVTADDVGGFARADSPDRHDFSARELVLTSRARENVWVEVGWFWGRLGRQRVFLWIQEELELPSDLQGAAWTRGNLDEAWDSIEAFLYGLRNPNLP